MIPTPSQLAAFYREIQTKQWLCAAIEAAEADGRSVALPMSAQAAAVARYIVDHNLPAVDLEPLSASTQDVLLEVVAAAYSLRRALDEKLKELARDIVRLDNTIVGHMLEHDDDDAGSAE
jgi:hypothetical protein